MATIPYTQHALIFWDHLEEAVKKTSEDYPGEEIARELLEVLIHNQEYFFKQLRQKFGEAMRLALTASCIRLPNRRTLYASALAHYYNPRAVRAAERVRKGARRPASKQDSPVLTTKEPTGQIAFVF